MNLKGKFVALLIGECTEMKVKKGTGEIYPWNTVAIVQDGMAANLRITDGELFKALKDQEHFKRYEFVFEYNTDYQNFVVVNFKPYAGVGTVK